MIVRLCDNAAEWNQAVLELDGTVYQSWQWGELRRSRDWIPWRVLVEEETAIRATIQIFERRAPILPATVLYAPHGIACRRDDSVVLGRLVEWLRGFMAERKAVFLRIDPPIADTDEGEKRRLTTTGFRILCERGSMWNLPRATMVLDISPSEKELLSAMRRTHRQLICRAPKKGVTFDCGSDVQRMQDFYDLLLKSSRRQGFAVQGFDYFLRIQRTLLGGGMGQVFLARYEQRAVAGALCARFGPRCYYLYGGFDWDYRHLEASEPLQWRVIQWARDAGCRWYDTGGMGTSYPPTEGNWGYGVYNYKKGFGASVCYSAGLFDLVSSPTSYALFRLLERRLFPRAYKLIGSLVYKARNFHAARSRWRINRRLEKPA